MRALRGLNDPLSVYNEAIYTLVYNFETLDDGNILNMTPGDLTVMSLRRLSK